jgi:flagellar hook-associated protein 3 FlgL
MSTMQMHNSGVESLLRQQSVVSRTQLQLSTVKKILSPSDDPSGAARILNLNRAIGELSRYDKGTTTARDRLGLQDQTLESVTQQIFRLKELSIQGANGTQSNESRKALATEVNEALGYLMRLANTRSGDEYIFSGFQSHTEPFVKNANGDVVFHGDQGVRDVQIGPGRTIQISDSGYDVFMAIKGGNGTFQTAAQETNQGTGVATVGTVTDPTQWVPDDYEVRFANTREGELGYYLVGGNQQSLVAAADSANTGDGTIVLTENGGHNNPHFATPLNIVFEDPADLADPLIYRVLDANTGVELGSGNYNSGDNLFPTALPLPDSFDPGYELVINDGGTAFVAGDTFTVDPNLHSFIPGQAITDIPGVSFNINGDPQAGDSFAVQASVDHSLFDTVKDLYELLNTPTYSPEDQALFDTRIGKVMEELSRDVDEISKVRASVGARLNAVDTEISANEGAALELKVSLSATEDLDVVEAISRFNLQLMSLQAAQSSFSKIQGLSLFKYL